MTFHDDHDDRTDLDWLAAAQPPMPAPGATATASARDALLAHARAEAAREVLELPQWVAGEGEAPAPAAAPAARSRASDRPAGDRGEPMRSRTVVSTPLVRGRSRRRVTRLLAGAALAAALVGIGVGALPSGGGESGGGSVGVAALAPRAAEAAPLVRLATRVQQAPAPVGDATLVLRTQAVTGSGTFSGADLYYDDGRYFYGETLDQLRAAVANGDDIGASPRRFLAAAVAAATGDAEAVRRQMIDATWDSGPSTPASDTPGGGDAAGSGSSAGGSGGERTAPDAVTGADPDVAARKKAAGGQASRPASEQTIRDNRVWMGATDALQVGAGRADVRAGALKLLATIPTVEVSAARLDGRAVLRLRATDYPDRYQETVFVDAETGVPLKLVGGVASERPGVVVTYDVKRVTAANVLAR